VGGPSRRKRKRGPNTAIAKSQIQGAIRGRTVVLSVDPGLPDGSVVTVTLNPPPLSEEEKLATLRRLAGAWADDAEELDRYLEWNRQQRKIPRPEIEG